MPEMRATLVELPLGTLDALLDLALDGTQAVDLNSVELEHLSIAVRAKERCINRARAGASGEEYPDA